MEHFISVYDNRLSPEICEEAIERFEAAKDKFPGLILRADGNLAVEPSKKRTIEFIIENDPSWQRVENHLQQHYIVIRAPHEPTSSRASSTSPTGSSGRWSAVD